MLLEIFKLWSNIYLISKMGCKDTNDTIIYKLAKKKNIESAISGIE